jgi:hypothetical protein
MGDDNIIREAFRRQAEHATPEGVMIRAMANALYDCDADPTDATACILALNRSGFGAAEIEEHVEQARALARILRGDHDGQQA